ncbi:abortive infection family protein [uncultured Campylobacter sp.]|uniref:abortive infection family protein n=1 Tax=uncultured Campylobacter sp. TaxID=218934 RepID=UPI00261737C1|nr:abortive infection family protein [uncultured Campylobacter sp.]
MCLSIEESQECSRINKFNNEELIEHLKFGLKSASRSKKFIGYKCTREKVLSVPELKNRAPWFLKHCEDIESFYTFIKEKGGYEERCEYIDKEFDPIKAILKENIVFDNKHIQDIWQKALERLVDDPEGAIKLSRTLLESILKCILKNQKIDFNEKDSSLHDLYKKVSEILDFAPEKCQEEPFKRVLGGMSAIVSGIGEIRNKAGDGHGRSEDYEKAQKRHAEFLVWNAGAMSMFIFKTYMEKFSVSPSNLDFKINF